VKYTILTCVQYKFLAGRPEIGSPKKSPILRQDFTGQAGRESRTGTARTSFAGILGFFQRIISRLDGHPARQFIIRGKITEHIRNKHLLLHRQGGKPCYSCAGRICRVLVLLLQLFASRNPSVCSLSGRHAPRCDFSVPTRSVGTR
jgi:hypothetical protein